MLNIKIIAAIAYGLLVLLGGAIGYFKAKSKVSLISGTIGGVLLLIGALMQWQGILEGQILTIVVTTVLASVFAIRLSKTRKFVPAGLMLVAGVATLIIMLAFSPMPSS